MRRTSPRVCPRCGCGRLPSPRGRVEGGQMRLLDAQLLGGVLRDPPRPLLEGGRALLHAGAVFPSSHFDWYQVPASVLEPHLAGVPGDLRVLHVGCGTSTWTKDIGALPRVGSVLNTDINAPAVERMRALYADDERLRFEVMDAANMSLADGSFDVVLDKGLLDIFRPRGDGAVLRTALEMRRVLRSGGLLAFVSYSGREKQPLELAQWCTHHEVRDVNLYTCIKGEAEEQAFRSLTFEPPDVAREEL
ncbi:unnamed protein product [Prorocentrum cordatum]|uniref:Methyltransferase type 11 domain-containing protein n=1 Tax=Prorocentrum cordatum TaxID=2364126 RepID=A0ABN9WWF1_9DINO|nr:unnamed protein product [Polarella glacialis]